MDDLILISWLNDFVFCPVSIYFHQLYGDADRTLHQAKAQIAGTAAHKTIDAGGYSTRANILTGMDVISLKYGVVGKIDIFYVKEGLLVERKKHISAVYPGYVYQLYAQCVALREMRYIVNRLQLRSLDNNKVYDVPLPEEDTEATARFEQLLMDIRTFTPDKYLPSSSAKCNNCIYEPACDRSVADAEQNGF